MSIIQNIELSNDNKGIEFTDEYKQVFGDNHIDCLTGLYNHGFFQLYLYQEIQRYERYGRRFTLALIDIDSLSSVNRRQGHLQGEWVLKKIADIVRLNTRTTDLAARFSGDVFSVILTESNVENALVPLERIRSSVEENPDIQTTVSIGVAEYPKDAVGTEAILEKAQAALEFAKIGGKNRIHYAEAKKESKIRKQPVVLIVDDEEKNIKLMEAMLYDQNYRILTAAGGEAALDIVSRIDVDIVLLDIMMPEIDGYEVCRRIKSDPMKRLTPVVLVTALDDKESKVQGINFGADDFITKPPDRNELISRIRSLVNVKRLNNSLTDIENVLFSLASAVEAKDAYTQGHIERVANVAVWLGRKHGISDDGIESLRFGGKLHDIGKIGIAEAVLNKPGPLTDEEWVLMKAHPDVGYKICLPLERNLGAALSAIRHHHEKLDGTGYPNGLEGDNIPLEARIMAVADIYDALISDRPYRKGMPKEQALGILVKEAEEGKLDEEIVDHLIHSDDQELS